MGHNVLLDRIPNLIKAPSNNILFFLLDRRELTSVVGQ